MMSKTNNTRPAHTHTHAQSINLMSPVLRDAWRWCFTRRCRDFPPPPHFHAEILLSYPYLGKDAGGYPSVTWRLHPPFACWWMVKLIFHSAIAARLLKGEVWLLFCWCSALSVHSGKIRQRFWITCGACLVKDMLKVNADQKKKHLTIFTFLL